MKDLERWNIKPTRLNTIKAYFGLRAFRIVYLYRKRHEHKAKRHLLRYKFWSLIMLQLEKDIHFDESAEIGNGLKIIHCVGLVIAPAKIGDNCTIHQNVTVGHNYKKNGKNFYPVIGNNVTLACGSAVLGPVTIGNNVLIAANAVVVSDVPDNCVVGGVPAKIIGKYGEARFERAIF